MTPAGERNQLITIQRVTETADGKGGQTESWATRGTEWAKEDQVSASEAQLADQRTGVRVTAWLFPFRSDVSTKDRVVVDGRTMQVATVSNPDGRREDTRLVCVEVLP